MISILTDTAVGGSFMSWTIHYLSGKDQYYSAKNNSWIPVPDNPIKKTNAHGFDANQAYNSDITAELLRKLQPLNDSSQTIYAHPFMFVPRQTTPSFDQIIQNSTKRVLISLNPKHSLYYISMSPRGDGQPSFVDRKTFLTSPRDVYIDKLDYYYPGWRDRWGTDVWDERENFALSVKINGGWSYPLMDYVDPAIDHYRIDAMHLWTCFEPLIPGLFKYLGYELKKERFSNWLDVYQQWKKIHVHRIKFIFYYKLIIDYIVNGYHLDLEPFEFDIMQEAVIQRGLMYYHGLNLKNWQLEKFVDTKQLHDLLETCIHDVRSDEAFMSWCQKHLANL